jgi:hypothetical protein
VRNTEPFQSSAQTVQSSASPMVAPGVKPAVVQHATQSVSTPSKVTTQTASPIAAQATKPPVVPITQPVVAHPNVPAPPTLDTTSMAPPPPVSQTGVGSVGAPPSMDMGRPPVSEAGLNKQKVKKATHGFVPLAAPVDVAALKIQETAQNDSTNLKGQEFESWNFSSLWNKATEVTRVVAGNENVLKMANTVNSNLSKLADTIAPKIAIQHQIG